MDLMPPEQSLLAAAQRPPGGFQVLPAASRVRSRSKSGVQVKVSGFGIVRIRRVRKREHAGKGSISPVVRLAKVVPAV
jgi:hypothetical protein